MRDDPGLRAGAGAMGRRRRGAANVLIFISSKRRRSPVVPCATSTRVFGIVSESGLMRLLQNGRTEVQLAKHRAVIPKLGIPDDGLDHLWKFDLRDDLALSELNKIKVRSQGRMREEGSAETMLTAYYNGNTQSKRGPHYARSRDRKCTYRPWEARLDLVVDFVRVLRDNVMPTSRTVFRKSDAPRVSR